MTHKQEAAREVVAPGPDGVNVVSFSTATQGRTAEVFPVLSVDLRRPAPRASRERENGRSGAGGNCPFISQRH